MKFAAALVPVVALLACGSPGNPAKADPTVNQQIIDRYTHDIWPAISAYNADHSQGGPAAKQLSAVIEPNLGADQFTPCALRHREWVGRANTTPKIRRATTTTASSSGLSMCSRSTTARPR